MRSQNIRPLLWTKCSQTIRLHSPTKGSQNTTTELPLNQQVQLKDSKDGGWGGVGVGVSGWGHGAGGGVGFPQSILSISRLLYKIQGMKECYVNLDYKETQKCSDIYVFYNVPSPWQSSFTLYQPYSVPSTWQSNLTNTTSQTWYPQHDKVVSQTLHQLNLLNGFHTGRRLKQESSILSIINDLSLHVLSILFLAMSYIKKKRKKS